MVRACGPRIRSLWRFARVGRRPVNAAKPADVNSLICEDEEECFLTIEYRVSIELLISAQGLRAYFKTDLLSYTYRSIMIESPSHFTNQLAVRHLRAC